MAATPTDLAWAVLKVDDEPPEIPYRFRVDNPILEPQRLRWLENPEMVNEQLDPGYRAWEHARFLQAATDPEWMERFGGRQLEPEESGLLGEEEKETPDADTILGVPTEPLEQHREEMEEEEEESRARQGAGTMSVNYKVDEHGRMVPVTTVSHGQRQYATEPKLHGATRPHSGRTTTEANYGDLESTQRAAWLAEHDKIPELLARIDAGMEEEVHAPPPSGFVSVTGPSERGSARGGQQVWIPKETYERPHPAFGAKEEETDG